MRQRLSALIVLSAMLCSSAAIAADGARASAKDGFLYFRTRPGAIKTATKLTDKPAATVATPVRKLFSARDERALSAAVRGRAIERSFSFTPSGQSTDAKSVTLGIATRQPAESALGAGALGLGSDVYDLGVAVGYGAFALEAGVNRNRDRPLTASQGVDVGVSYRGDSWRTSLHVAEEDFHTDGRTTALGPDRSYSLKLGGAYHLTPRLSLSGGVKYSISYLGENKAQAKRGEQTDSSVFLGTEINF